MKLATYKFLKESAEDFEIAMRENDTFRAVDTRLRSLGYGLDELYYDNRGRLHINIYVVDNSPYLPEIAFYPRDNSFKIEKIISSVRPEDAQEFLTKVENAVKAVEMLEKLKDSDLDITHEDDFLTY